MRRAGLPPVGAAGATVGVAIGDHVGGLVNFMSQPEQPGRWMGFTRLRGMGEPGLSAVDRSGRGLSAEGLKRGDQYVLRPRSRVVLGLALSVCGALLCAVELAERDRSDLLVTALLAGPLSGLVMWLGLAAGPLASLTVTCDGLRVRNPFTRVDIPWCDLAGATVGQVGLRLRYGTRETAVFVAQVANRDALKSQDDRPIDRLASTLLSIRDRLYESAPRRWEDDGMKAVRRLNAPPVALLCFLLFNVAVIGSLQL